MKKKILIFTLFYYPNPVSGAEVAVKEITDRLKNDKGENLYEFHMVTLRGTVGLPTQSKEGEVIVHRIFPGANKNPNLGDFAKFPFLLYKYFFQIFGGLYAILLNWRYNFDAIWILMPQTAGVPASIFNLLNPKVPIILTLQEGDPIPHIERSVAPLWPLFARIFRKASVVQAISGYLADWARSRGSKCPVHVIYNGANENDFKTEIDEDLKQKMLEKIAKKEGEILLVSTSRLVEKNAMDDCISALRFLPENIRLVIAGSGDDFEKLTNQVKEMKLENRVMFLGQVDRKETAILRRIGDIFVRPSRSEGLGNSFAGAFAARIPVIATQEGGIAEFLFDKDKNPDKPTTGFAVDANSPKQIAEQVKFILENKEYVKTVVENAYNLVVTDYRWDNIAKYMKEKCFDFVLNNN